MTKTPEQMATDWYIRLLTEEPAVAIKEAYKAGYQAAQQWISVKERLPDRDQEVLGYEEPFISTCIFWRSRSLEHRWELSNGLNCNPTHWMSLPKPPEGKE